MKDSENFMMTAMLTYRRTIRAVTIQVCPSTGGGYSYILFSKDRVRTFVFERHEDQQWAQIGGADFGEEALAAIYNMLTEIDDDLKC